MKKNFFSRLLVLVMALCATINFSSCSNDDDPTEGVTEGLVNETLPTQKGWSGSFENGICTYTPSSYTEYPSYYAFSFNEGSCNDAVFNVICDSEEEARYISNMLNNGTFDDLEDDDYSYQAAETSILTQSLHQIKAIKQVALKCSKNSRADLIGITCTQSGKVVFFKLKCFTGKNGETIKTAVEAWNVGIDTLPEAPLFGTYDRNTGKYTNDNIMGIPNSKYEINTLYEGNKLTEFVTTLTLPNSSWAEALAASFYEQSEDYIEMFGQAPQISQNGAQVTVKAIIIGEVTRETIEQYIITLDLMMNKPIATSLL